MADDKKGDIKFTFDSSEFKKGVEDIVKSMGKMETATVKSSAKTGSAVGAALGKFAVMATAIIGAFKGASAAITKFLPEIGTTFQIAGDIIGRNLLWPLRKELIPILQSVLNWARKNRENFVMLGGVLVNAFKVIKTIFTSILNMVSPVIDQIKNVLKSIFGDTLKSATDTINMIMVKIAAFSILASDVIKPVFEGIGKVIGAVVDSLKVFWGAIFNAVGKLFDKGQAGDLIITLKETFEDLADVLIKLRPVFEWLGEFVGTKLATSLNTSVRLLTVLLEMLQSVFKLISDPKNYKQHFADIGKSLMDYSTAWGEGFTKMLFGKAGNQIVDFARGAGSAPTENVQDAVITKGGKVIKTSPEDTLIATKTPGSGRSLSVNMNFGNFNITTTEGNAATTGENFIRGIESQIKNVLLNTLAQEGAM